MTGTSWGWQLVGLTQAHSVTREAGGVTSVPGAASRGLTATQPRLVLIYRLFQELSGRKSRQVLPLYIKATATLKC